MQGLGEAKDGMDGWNMDGMVWRVRMWTCVCEGWTCMWSADALPVNGWVVIDGTTEQFGCFITSSYINVHMPSTSLCLISPSLLNFTLYR